jgi:hypothetical protein
MEDDEDVELKSTHGDVAAVREAINTKTDINAYCLRTSDDGSASLVQ